MTRIVQSLAEMSQPYRSILCDLWGCLHNGVAAYPAAVEALRGFRAGGGKVVLLTNGPRPWQMVREQIDALGVPRDCYDAIASSGDAAREAIAGGAVGPRIYHLGPDTCLPLFDNLPGGASVEPVPLNQASGIVCTGLFDDSTETPDDYRAILLEARTRGLKMLCANPDLVVERGEMRIYCAGAIAKAYEEAGGEVLWLGKPYPQIYDLARRRLGEVGGSLQEADILAIGDGIATDIQGAMQEGFDTLFVTSGIAAPAFGEDRNTPDPQKLDAFLQEHLLSVTAAIPYLR
ncbi:HAD family hydrolase [Defluviimonas sp. 20V17]|uniref:HAD-superfamily class IIA hydrolase, TIGR01459 n=1 Tax=Allgaiera indica TaxID=765699 RepID=A0AAN4UPA9_9RHOB|nr:TIGR01459 family HAD-type hydrolase [Allgaiera indica]KDB03789.1 HAD family hydrolase [Defluviimonas sp. 20V17]GHD99931.1 haloacid dehalogenase [Allgaiera indica]SDW40376.1 HAD-superfamily class IIA hydrolase, TIGR01459 [Allgaiera indica]